MTSPASISSASFPSLSGYTFVEQLYSGSRTAVYRAVKTDQQHPVVIKVLQREYPSFVELMQFRNQYAIAQMLTSQRENSIASGVIRPLGLEPLGSSYALVMEDWGGVSLGKYIQQQALTVTEVLAIAVQMSDILHELYQHRVIHKDIKPANLLIRPESKQVKLIDFSIASLLPKENQEIQNPNRLEGTLAYLAPEQTGRMNRGIDYRADYYSLGVTLYQLLTGSLPFTTEEPIELMHCHMAKMPTPINQINPAVPDMVTKMVTKLMAKNAEDRYQNALGLKHDVIQCLNQWKDAGQITSFKLGKRDVGDRFLLPEKLYGRDTEVTELLAAFDRVSGHSSANSKSELLLVAGLSGIGKTAVINEIHKPIVRQHGYFIKGKFDQFNRNIPLSAFVQALRDLMGQLLSESDSQLQSWKANILKALGGNGQVLIDVLPELEQIIGKQPAVPELSGRAAQNRFNRLFQTFINIFSTVEHPLVLFLDDLQWADSTSLQLIKLIMNDNSHLLLLGAYRDNEVSAVHPFILTIEELRKNQKIINTITLGPLTLGDINHLIADTLNCSQALARPLSELIVNKTKGNPFFTTQFLKALHEEGHIRFDRDDCYWKCDIAQVKTKAFTDDVVEFMAMQLQKLPPDTQQVLKLAACIGNQFDLSTLAIVLETSQDFAAKALWEALKESLILPTSQVYNFSQSEEPNLQTKQNTINSTYRFLHDRVQQAAYCLIPETQKQKTHLRIGRLLLNSVSTRDLEDKIFNIVNHWNISIALVTESSERDQLCQLNLKAGYKAKGSTAYGTAHEYAVTGINLMAPDSWQKKYDLMLTLHELAAESAYLSGDYVKSQHWAEILLKQTKTILDEVKVHEISLLTYTAQKESLKAVALGQQILDRLGISIPISPADTDIKKALVETAALIPQSKIQALFDLPPMANTQALAALKILNSMAATVYLAQPKLFPLIVLEQVKLSLLHGNAPVSAGAYARYSFILCGKVNDIESGYEFGCLALSLSEQFNNKEISTRVLLMIGALTLPWKVHLKEGIPLLQRAYLDGLESGNLDGAALSHYYESQSSYIVGQELQDLVHKITTYSEQIREIKQELHLNNNELLRQVILNLTGQSSDPCQIMGDAFNEEEMQPLYQSSSNILGLYCLYLHKLMLCYWFGQGDIAVEHAALATTYVSGSTAQATVPLLYFYDSLARLSQYAIASAQEQQAILAQVTANQTKIQHWANHAPMNFQHKYDLVLAEQHHALGQKAEAIDLYDQAIAGAQANGYIQEEALANELAAKFYLNWGKEKIAQDYLTKAYYGYARWGAKAKIQDLEHRYPDLLKPVLQQQPMALSATETVFSTESSNVFQAAEQHSISSSASRISASLDLATVLKASQTLSSEIQLDKLLTMVLHTVIENAGADKGVLVMPHENHWFVEAIASSDQPVIVKTIALSQSLDVPQALIHTVKRSLESVVIVDAVVHPTWAVDAYVVEHQPKSLLCTPILQQGKLIAILYLENQFTVGAFTSDRVKLLNFLCAQAAISIQNSILYQKLETAFQDAHQKSQDLAEAIALSNGQQQILELIAQRLPLNTILEETARLIESQCHHPAYCSFLRFDAEEGKLYHLAAPSLPADYNALIDGIRIGPEVGSCGTAAYNKASVTVNDIAKDPLWSKYQIALDFGLRACASTPILGTDGQVLATLAMYQPESGKFTLHDRKLMKSATYLARIALERQQADQKLQNLHLQMMQGEKMASLGNLVAGVAHEINNPIGFLNGSISNGKDYVQDLLEYVNLYQQHHPDVAIPVQEKADDIDLEFLTEDLPKLLNSMQGATGRIKSISNSLRTFSRADTEYKVRANIHEGIDSTLLILKYRLKATETRPAIQVIQDYGDLPKIECFPGQLNQVFMNILANAIDALEEGNHGKSYADIEAEPNQISIQTVLMDRGVNIHIRDNGTGMPEAVKQRIFEHLYTTKEVGKGTGLGLAIVHQIIVGKHGGKITVNSAPSQGTEFILALPL